MNRITVFIIICFLAITSKAYSQNWHPIGPDDIDEPTYISPGFFYKMILNDSNEPVVAFDDFFYQGRISVRQHTAAGWTFVGAPGFSAGQVTAGDFKEDNAGTLYVAYSDGGSAGTVTIKKFDGNTWQNVGNVIATSGTSYVFDISLALNSQNEPYVAYTDGSDIVIKMFDGTGWANVGSSSPLFNGGSPVLAFDSNDILYTAFIDWNANYPITVMKFDGGTWTNLSSPGFSGFFSLYSLSMVINNAGFPIITYKDGVSDNIVVQQFDGTNWANIGSPVPGYQTTIALGLNDTLYQAYSGITAATGALIVRKYDGTNWIQTGTTPLPENFQLSLAVSTDNMLYAASKDVTGTVIQYDGNEWNIIAGFGITGDKGVSSSIAIDHAGIPYVLCGEQSLNNKAVMKKYINGNWVNVGTPGFSNHAIYASATFITNKDTIYAAYAEDTSGISVQKFNGNDWVNVGNTGQIPFSYSMDMAVDTNNTPYVVYSDYVINNGAPTVKKFDGTDWQTVGTAGFDPDGAWGAAIALDKMGVPYVAYTKRSGSQEAVVKKFDGTAWVDVGGAIGNGANANTNYTDIAIDDNNVPYIIFSDNTDSGRAAVKKFNGTDWEMVGADVSAGAVWNVSIAVAANNKIYVSYVDNSTFTLSNIYSNGIWSPTDTISHGLTYTTGVAAQGNNAYIAYSVFYGVFAKGYTDTTASVNNVPAANLKFELYPNPVADYVNISLDKNVKAGQATIYNAIGSKQQTWQLADGKKTYSYPVSNLAPGLYFITINSEYGACSLKFIKR